MMSTENPVGRLGRKANRSGCQPVAWRPSAFLSSTSTVVAIGDVHGCASLLDEELEAHYGSGAELIFLGDLIDRSPEPDGDRKVLERILTLQQNPGRCGLAGVTVLRGNHEQMLLDALAERRPSAATDVWLLNGGSPAFLVVARDHRRWLASLPHSAIRGGYLFVHAGVRPGVPLAQQSNDDLLWIRRPFLAGGHHGLPYTVVHGHTFRRDFRITRLPHRIGIDTGAFRSGKLTALPIQMGTESA